MSARVRISLRATMVPMLALTAGCVTSSASDSSDLDLQMTAITIPLQSSGTSPRAVAVDQYYQSIMVQLQDAMLERNPELILGLIEQHTRAGAPAWALDQMAQFRKLAAGLRFELHLEATGSVEEVGGPRALGEELSFVLRIPPSTDHAIRLFGSGEAEVPARFVTSLRVQDHDCYGSRSRQVFNEIVPLPKGVDFGAGGSIELPFLVAALPPEGARRTVRISIDLMPGTIMLGDEVIPNSRVKCAETELEIYPRGVELIRANPYTNLRNAALRGDPELFDHVSLAAHFMPEEHREAAMALLIERVRLGSPALSRVCRAALAEMTGAPVALDDRLGWLRWWQDRSPK